MNLVQELKWRGMLHQITPETEDYLQQNKVVGYVGFDPTSDSLHVGSLVPIILLKHLQNHGHQPIALIGGATGMIGDPSGKSDERNLLDEQALNLNIKGIQQTLSRFFDFDSTSEQKPMLLNNYDWMRSFGFIEFARDVGKRITVNYMMAKDSVKKRIDAEQGGAGMSFTEFTYQLIQGYDFYHLHKNYNCVLQMGGSDQWGNITTGMELIRRLNKESSNAFAITCPLTTKKDGGKFGKSEQGNIWLDAKKTSVYEFYQFWLNQSDEDAAKYIKIYTFLDQKTIEEITKKHKQEPHLRLLQQTLAKEITAFVHGAQELATAQLASKILFGKSTQEDLKQLNADSFLEIFKGVPTAKVNKDLLVGKGLDVVEALSTIGQFMSSKSEARRALKENSISLNKVKVQENYKITTKDLLNNQHLLLQRGKRKYFILTVES